MSGGNQSEVKIVLRNPLDYNDSISYCIKVYDNPLAKDWVAALKKLLQSGNLLEKNFCFMGFPKTTRNLEYLCSELNSYILQINNFNATEIWQNNGLDSYIIEDYYTPDVVRYGPEYPYVNETVSVAPAIYFEKTLGYRIKHGVMNRLHNHFERLQGTAWKLSEYYILADYKTKYAIRQLNTICHEIENLVLSQHKMNTMPEWVRPSQITTFLHAERYDLTLEHKQICLDNGFNRRFGEVYMHWSQIGKTLMEVFRDENAPQLNIGDDPTDISIGSGSTCEAITALKYYTGEFDIEWGNDIVQGGHKFHDNFISDFYTWLENNQIDKNNLDLCLGYLPIGQVQLQESFGTTDCQIIWDILSKHLDIYQIEVDGISNTFEYSWADKNYKQMQIDMMRPGYDFSSRG
jgi:hypothetical protein